MAKQRITGYIQTYKRLVKPKKGKPFYRYYVRKKFVNGNKADSNTYATRQGMNRKARDEQKLNPSMVIQRLGLKN